METSEQTPSASTSAYRRLDPQAIIRTAEQIHARIRERFSGRSLAGVANEVVQVAKEARDNAVAAAAPLVGLRILVGIVVLGLIGTELGLGVWLIAQKEASNWSDYMQGIDASINSVILSAGAIIFLVSSERRMKRRRVLRALHELRALAHVIDMHQLTKDPDRLFRDRSRTQSSPPMDLTPGQLNRYLDYCSELLAILSNVAAIYAQGDDDQVTLDGTDSIAALCTGISRKIWQKMEIVERMREGAAP